MISRRLQPMILAALGDNPVVFLQGPRQSGKSTLAQSLIGPSYQAQYLTLDDAAVLAAASRDPQGFIAGLGESTVIDEVQRAPELFLAIKVAVDRDRRPGQFLLTGSVGIVPALADALVGRVEILTLWPFSQGEIEGSGESFMDRLFDSSQPEPALAPTDQDDLLPRILRGGFPEAVQRRSTDRRREWFASYLMTILQRDVRDLSNIEGLRDLPRLLSLLAARTSCLLNYSELSRSSAIPQTTLKRYLALLEATFLVQMLPAWTTNIGKRVVKSPKVLLGDTGLASSVLGADERRLKTDPTLTGQLLETFVAMELRKQASWSRTRSRIFHYRSHASNEVDIVLEEPGGRIVGIEVKASSSVAARDVRGLAELADAAGPNFVRGIVLYRGDQIVPFGRNVHAMPVASLWCGVTT